MNQTQLLLETPLLSGKVKDNLEDGWLGSHTIEIFVDGVLAGITSSQDNGSWSLQWTVPESMDVGNHSVSILAPEQGFYRSSSSDSSFTVSITPPYTLRFRKPTQPGALSGISLEDFSNQTPVSNKD